MSIFNKAEPVIINFEGSLNSSIYYLIPRQTNSYYPYHKKKYIKNFILETINKENDSFFIIKPKMIILKIKTFEMDHNRILRYSILYVLVLDKLIEIEKIKYHLISKYNDHLSDVSYYGNRMNENYTESKISFFKDKKYRNSKKLDIKQAQNNMYQYEISELLDQ